MGEIVASRNCQCIDYWMLATGKARCGRNIEQRIREKQAERAA
jgi:hypothetical protein